MTPAERNRALALALGALCVVLDTTITVVAVPALVLEFAAPIATTQWVTVGYGIAVVATMPIAPWLASRFGAPRTYAVALLGFAVASIGVGCAPDLPSLIGARVVQGLAGGIAVALVTSIGLADVPAHRRGRVAALLGLPVLIGPLLGPVLAGWLIDDVSWRALFFLVVPPALVAAVLVPRLAAQQILGSTRPPLDLRGLALATPGLTLLVLGAGGSFATGWRCVAGAVGLLLLVSFARHCRRTPRPLLRLPLLSRPEVGLPMGVLAAFSAAYFGGALLLPVYVQLTRGDAASTAGLLALPAALATGLSLQICTRLIDRVPARLVIASGAATSALAVAAMIAVLRDDTSYVVVAGLSALQGLGCGAVLLPAQASATRLLHGEDLTSLASLAQIISQSSNSLGTAAITACFTLAALHTDPVSAQRWALVAVFALTIVALAQALRIRTPATTPPLHQCPQGG